MKKKLKIFTLILITSIFMLDICLNKVYADTTYENYEKVTTVACGNGTIMPSILPKTISIIYTIIQISIPIVLVILGTMDLIKGVAASKEDEIKKSQQIFFKRLISAVLVFFVFVAVKFVIGIVSKNSENIMGCVDCVINNNNSCKKHSYINDGSWECTILTKYSQGNNLAMEKYIFKSNGEILLNKTTPYYKEIYSEFKPSFDGECPSDQYIAIEKTATINGQYGYTYTITKK